MAASTTKKPVRKPARKAAKPVVKPAPVEAPKGSVTGTFKLARMPKGDGGVRFEVENGRPFSPVYLAQSDFAEMGEPQRIRATYTAL
jgi:hypothetical protein